MGHGGRSTKSKEGSMDQPDSNRSPWKTGFRETGAPVASRWASWAQCEWRRSRWTLAREGSASLAPPSAAPAPGTKESTTSSANWINHFINQLLHHQSINAHTGRQNTKADMFFIFQRLTVVCELKNNNNLPQNFTCFVILNKHYF